MGIFIISFAMSDGSLTDIITFINQLKDLDFYDAVDGCCDTANDFIALNKRCLMGECWTWDQFTGYIDTIHSLYNSGDFAPAMVVFFTFVAGFMGSSGNSDALSGDAFLYNGLAIIMSIAVGSTSALYIASKTVENGMNAQDKLRYEDYGGQDIVGDLAGIFVTLNIALYLGAGAMIALAPLMLAREAFTSSADPYTLLTMGVMITAGEWAGAYALGEVASSLLGWFTKYRKQTVTVATVAGDVDISGLAFAVDVLNQTLLTAGYFLFAMALPSGTWTYAHFILTGNEVWRLPYIGSIFPLSLISGQ